MWFEVKGKRVNEDGAKVSESYLMEAASFADAENRAVELAVNDIEDIDVVKKTKVNELYKGEGGWYLAKVGLITLDEKSGAEKVATINCYTQAGTFDEAVRVVKENMKNSMSDWRMVSLSETNIVEVYELGATEED